MPATGLDVFDSTVQVTNEWLKDLMAEMHTEDKHLAYQALRGTLHAVRDRLPVDEAAHLSAQLPMLIRGLYYEGYHPAHKPITDRSRDAFLQDVAKALTNIDESQVFLAAQSAFKVITKRIAGGEVAEVRQSLPGDVREMWPWAA